MKNITVKSHFKKVSDKSSNRYGEKRPDLEWQFNGLEAQDFTAMDDEALAKVATLANATLESYGRKLLLQNNDDWDFDPSEYVTIDKVYDDLTSTITRKRKVTKETLAKCGEFYARWASLIGKEEKAANAGSRVIAEKLQPIAGKAEALEVMRDNLLQLIEKASEESANNIKLSEELEANADCLEWLVSECDSLVEDSKVDLADSL